MRVLVLWGCNLYQVTKSAHTPSRAQSISGARAHLFWIYTTTRLHMHTSGVIDTNRELTIMWCSFCVFVRGCCCCWCAIAIQVELSKASSLFALWWFNYAVATSRAPILGSRAVTSLYLLKMYMFRAQSQTLRIHPERTKIIYCLEA
jgi:hypothetical protein